MTGSKSKKKSPPAVPEVRLVAWEVTRTCNLSCIHCRAASVNKPYPNELTTSECLDVIDQIASFARPVVILTGGEPLLRRDVFEIASYGTQKSLRMVMATNGTLLSDEVAARIKQSGIQRVSISLDGTTEKEHDAFRRMPGAFRGSMRGIECLKRAGIEFQINSSITMMNVDEVPGLLKMAQELGAVAHHIFMLVEVGRGEDLEDVEIPPDRYEQVLRYLSKEQAKVPIHIKATCAPQYYRVMAEQAGEKHGKRAGSKRGGLDAVTSGCLGGKAFCFISHVGRIQPCGYLELDCGNVRDEGLREAWARSEIFTKLRTPSQLVGKCGRCEYRVLCGGCRARALTKKGDFMDEDPCCIYEPQARLVRDRL